MPESGIYVFTWTMTSFAHSIVSSELMLTGTTIARTTADSDEVGDRHTSTGIIVISCSKDDHVYIKFSASENHGHVETGLGLNSFFRMETGIDLVYNSLYAEIFFYPIPLYIFINNLFLFFIIVFLFDVC